jgi:hypothetical protein
MGRHLVCTFARCQPPHVGHRRVWQEIQTIATKVDGDPVFFLSKTHRPPDNPLTYERKSYLLRELVPDVRIGPPLATWPAIVDAALDMGYSALTIVVGSDRLAFTEQFVRNDARYRARMNYPTMDCTIVIPVPRSMDDASGSALRSAVLESRYDDFRLLGYPLASSVGSEVYANMFAAMHAMGLVAPKPSTC